MGLLFLHTLTPYNHLNSTSPSYNVCKIYHILKTLLRTREGTEQEKAELFFSQSLWRTKPGNMHVKCLWTLQDMAWLMKCWAHWEDDLCGPKIKAIMWKVIMWRASVKRKHRRDRMKLLVSDWSFLAHLFLPLSCITACRIVSGARK